MLVMAMVAMSTVLVFGCVVGGGYVMLKMMIMVVAATVIW
jgi:hypothetical protein